VRRALELPLFGLALVTFIIVVVVPERDSPGFDLAPLVTAGQLVATGEETHLYDHDPARYNVTGSPAFETAARQVGFRFGSTPFVYPPLVAWAMQPFARVGMRDVMAGWTWLAAALTLAALWLALRRYAPAWNRPLVWAGVLALLCLFEPVRYGFWLGQTTPLILVLVLGANVLARDRRDVGAGVALALAAFIKLTPALFALIWLWRGPRRAFAWFTAATAILWLASLARFGTDLHAEYIARVREIASTVVTTFNNHSFVAMLTRLSGPPSLVDWTLHPIPFAVWALAMMALAGLAAVAAWKLRSVRGDDGDDGDALAHGLAFIIILLAPSISWTHYFVYLLPVAAIVAVHARSLPRVLAALSIVLCCRPLLAVQSSFRADQMFLPLPTIAAALMAASLLVVVHERGTHRAR
jgi:hypothetical protein